MCGSVKILFVHVSILFDHRCFSRNFMLIVLPQEYIRTKLLAIQVSYGRLVSFVRLVQLRVENQDVFCDEEILCMFEGW